MARKTLTFALLALMAITAHAQHFDWVKSYTGSDRPGHVDNWIVSSVTDNDGNLYILGQCAHDAQIEGIPLVPINNHQECILIAKISPDGNIVWHKEIATPLHNSALSIRMVGDTAIACMVGVTLRDEVYYLDTLYSDANHQIMPTDSLDQRSVTAFITLNLDGQLQEQHFLQIAFLDNERQVITTNRLTSNPADSSTVYTRALSGGTFDVDSDGNIIVVRPSPDVLGIYDSTGDFSLNSIENGGLSGLQIWVDGHARFSVYPQNNPREWNPMLLKFSPSFTHLLGYQYIFQNENGENTLDHIYSMTTDQKRNVYFIVTETVSDGEESTANINNLSDVFHRKNSTNSFVIKCDSNLNPVFFKQINMEGIGSFLELHSLILDASGRNLFVSGHVYSFEGSSPAAIGEDTIDIVDKVFFLNIDTETGRLNTYGNAKSSGVTKNDRVVSSWQHQMCAANNRVFVPCYYTGNLFFGVDSIYNTDYLHNAVCIWDTLGNKIGFIDMPTNSTNRTQPCYTISLKDSTLYISGFLVSNSTVFLGDTDISFAGNSMAYIAKYVDTSFMTPYVHTEEPGEVSITLVEDGAALVAYPNPFRQSVRIKVQGGQLKEHNGTVTAILTDLSGRREEVRLTPDAPGQYTLDLTSRPQATYLLTLTTSDGLQHTVRLLKQSDIFGN